MFLETLEKLNIINKVVALSFHDWSFTTIFGLIFLVLLALVFISKNKLVSASKRFDGRTCLLVLLVLAWSPMFFDSFFSSWWTMSQQSKLAGSAATARIQSRMCAIDKNQNLGNSVCLLVPFVEEVKALVPSQSKVALTSGGYFSLFLQYYFIPDYQLTSPESANYWLLYLPESGYQIDANQDLIEISGDTKKNWGRWQVVRFFSDGMIILKR